MPSLINSCLSAEEAVDDDVEKSPKTRKEVAVGLYGDKTVNQAHQLFVNTLNPNQDYPRMGAEQAIRICTLCGEGSTYLRYVFDNLQGLLNNDEAKKFLLHSFSLLANKLSKEDAEIIATNINEALGYETPVRQNKNTLGLEETKKALTLEIQDDIKAIYDKVAKVENLDKKLRPKAVLKETG